VHVQHILQKERKKVQTWSQRAPYTPQMVLQVFWIRDLYRDKPVDDAQLKYAPIYVLGNLCIAGWMIFWNNENFGLSQLLVTVNTLSQLFAVSQLPPITSASALTHWVAKTTAGIGILDLLDNGAVALRYPGPPSLTVQALTAGLFGLASASSDLILGGCIVYDIIALAFGQRQTWGGTLAWYAAGSAAIVAVKNIFLN